MRRFFLAAAVALVGQWEVSAQSGAVITGRVVDRRGRPVAGAGVTLHPLARAARGGGATSQDGLIVIYETAGDGTFRIGDLPGISPPFELYAVGAVPPGAYAPLRPPFRDLQGDRLIAGKIIRAVKGRTVHEGDVPLHASYRVFVADLRGGAQPATGKGRAPVRMLVRDARGDVVSDGSVPPQAVAGLGQAVTFALPQGLWCVELVGEGAEGGSASVYAPVVVSYSAAPAAPPTALSPAAGLSAASCLGTNGGPRRTPAAARRELRRLGFQFNRETFFSRVVKGNAAAVQLFLTAGFGADAKDRRGTPALVLAVPYPNILKLLLDSGARPDASNPFGETALIHASVAGVAETVRLLLAAGADPSAGSRDGTTPLMLASESGDLEIVEALIKAGADVNARNRQGMTALKFARHSGEADLVNVLIQAGARE
jgi:hypothetical protein